MARMIYFFEEEARGEIFQEAFAWDLAEAEKAANAETLAALRAEPGAGGWNVPQAMTAADLEFY